MPKSRAKTAQLTSKEGEWFRARFLAKDDECRDLRALIQAFAFDLAKDGSLAGRLLAMELDKRLAKIHER